MLAVIVTITMTTAVMVVVPVDNHGGDCCGGHDSCRENGNDSNDKF